MNILVFLHSRKHFGAQIVHVPALFEIRKKYPDARVHAVSKFNQSSLLRELGLIDELYVGSGVFFCLKQLFGIRFEARFSFRPTSHSVDWAMRFLGIRQRIGFSKFAGFLTSYKNYSVTRYRAISFFSLVSDPDLYYKTTCQRIADHYIDREGPYQGAVILAPGAGGKEKRWPVDRFISLAEKLSGSFRIVFLVGPEDRDEANAIEQDGRFDLVRTPSIQELFGMVVNSRLFISGDCGPAHVAHITYKPQIVLFRQVLEEWFDFRGSSTAIGGAGDILNIPVARVLDCPDCICE